MFTKFKIIREICKNLVARKKPIAVTSGVCNIIIIIIIWGTGKKAKACKNLI